MSPGGVPVGSRSSIQPTPSKRSPGLPNDHAGKRPPEREAAERVRDREIDQRTRWCPSSAAIADSLRRSFAPSSEKRKAMTKRTLLVGVAAGAAAGLAMAAVEMIYGWASSAHSAWDAPMGIWAYIGGLNHFGRAAGPNGPIVLGIG